MSNQSKSDDYQIVSGWGRNSKAEVNCINPNDVEEMQKEIISAKQFSIIARGLGIF